MSSKDFRRIAILNRGEPALRFLRALREYDLERGTRTQAVAFYTDPDAGAAFVRGADGAVHLGPALVPGGDGRLVSAYCHHAVVLGHLQAAGCDAVWPGWGFVSEDADFVAALEAAGIAFLGPSARAMRLLGDKIAARRLAEDAGVPLAPWHLVEADSATAAPPDADSLLAAAARVGYPLMVKASGGGGGRGIRRVDAPGHLLEAVERVRDEARRSFGKGGLFLEACVTGARHVEVQLVCGADGRARALGVRDCSVQRRNQKVVEEAPSPVLPEAMAARLLGSAERLCESAGYRGVATAEFLYRPDRAEATFLEVNSRLQVEHTVTELVTGCDLVHAQIDIARGLPWQDPGPGAGRGHAIEVRLNAEDPERGFAPSPGIVRLFRVPGGPGVRVDAGVTEGMAIAPEFDSMIAKIIAWAPTRPQALARLQRALRELAVVVEDGATNKGFLLDLLAHPAVVDATADTGWLDRAMTAGGVGPPAWTHEALLFAAVASWRTQRHADVQRFFAEVQGGIPQHLPAPEGLRVDLRLRGRAHGLDVFAIGPDRYLVGRDAALHAVAIEPTGPCAAVLHVAGRRHQVLYSHGRNGIGVEVDGALHVVELASGGAIRAPAPAMVVHVAVQEGDTVAAGDRLCTLEAMKMEMPLFAPEPGRVRAVLCRANQQVLAGQVLVELAAEVAADTTDTADMAETVPDPAAATAEPDEGAAAATTEELRRRNSSPEPVRAPLDRLLHDGVLQPALLDTLSEAEAQETVDELCAAVRSVLLGFDVPPAFAARLERLLGLVFDFRHLAYPQRWAPLTGLLATFGDVEALFDRTLLPLADRAAAVSAEVAFYELCRRHHLGDDAAPAEFRPLVQRALRAYGVHELEPGEPLRQALWRLAVAHGHAALRHRICSSLLRLVMDMHAAGVALPDPPGLRAALEQVAAVARPEHPHVADHARQAIYLLFEQSRFVARRQVVEARVEQALASGDEAALADLVRSPDSLLPLLVRRADPARPDAAAVAAVLLRRVYADRDCRVLGAERRADHLLVRAEVDAHPGEPQPLFCVFGDATTAAQAVAAAHAALTATGADPARVEVVLHGAPPVDLLPAVAAALAALPAAATAPTWTLSWCEAAGRLRHRTWQLVAGALAEAPLLRDIHPETARRIELWRLGEFELERLDAPEQIVALRGRGRSNPDDERIFVFAEVRDLPPLPGAAVPAADADGGHLWQLEQAFHEALRVLREAQAGRAAGQRLLWNRLTLLVRPIVQLDARDVMQFARPLEAATRGLGLEKVVIGCRVVDPASGGVRQAVFVVSKRGRHRLEVVERPPTPRPVRAMTPYDLRVVRARRLGNEYPYEIARMLGGEAVRGEGQGAALPHPDMAHGRFHEHDLDDSGTRLQAVRRPYGQNRAAVVVGTVVHYTARYPEGMERVWLASDPTLSMGSLAEPECRRIIAALDLAEERGLPVEWLPVSSGARIAMDSGTENLDWTARVLRRVVEFTQRGGVLHVLVAGVNVGAQSYWNAEATMLMHTRGILVMTPQGAMVLTGKKALEYSGGVAAEDERGIGGFERIMGPNGQAQYFARDLGEAYAILFEHYRFSYRKPSEPGPRPLPSADPPERSILEAPYRGEEGFATLGEIFDDRTNPGRKRPFAIREVMAALVDRDGGHLERFRTVVHGETAVVWDAQVGGHAVCLIGFESRPLSRRGRIPLDGPESWTGGTLFPRSSKKVARALNACSGVRPVVVLANLSGFDGSPESLRKLQLEYGAEIGRAVVNFEGPIVFVVVGRYHGGAYVVFSKALNPNLTALALEGSFASVIGGAPAAAVVFPREVRRRAEADPRVQAARAAVQAAPEGKRPRLREKLESLLADVVLDMQGEVAREFDAVHSVQRAVAVGSLDAVIAPERLRPAVIERLEAARGQARVVRVA